MYRDLTKGNLITIIISLITAIVSFGCVVYLIPQITNTQMQLFFTTVISTIGAAFLVNFLWEIFAKKRFAESVLEMAKISKNIEQSGVDHIDIDFSSINWQAELTKTHNLTAIFTYAQTWRNSNRVTIQQRERTDLQLLCLITKTKTLWLNLTEDIIMKMEKPAN